MNTPVRVNLEMMPVLIFILFLTAALQTNFAQKVPALEWVKQLGNSGQVAVPASATDRQGNLYIAGTTSSLAFPVAGAAQPRPGGSPLVRIDSGAMKFLLDPLLTGATKFALDPETPSTLYAGAAGTLIRSIDSGDSWTVIGTFPNVSGVGSISVDPSSSQTLYVAANADGLYRSGDGGTTWQSLNRSIPPFDKKFTQSFYVNQVWVDPWSSAVFASSSAGLIRSADSGMSWTVVRANEITSSVAFDPFTAGTVYESSSSPALMGKSTDAGFTWTVLVGAPQGYPSQLIADPLHRGVLYFGVYSGIYQSWDGGVSWTEKTNQPSSAIAADPTQPVLYGNLGSPGLVRSIDGFTTYQPAGPLGRQATQILIGDSHVFVAYAPSTDVFVVELDSQGAIVYSTYFGGSGSESATGLAMGADGSVYVTGSTSSIDFPVTAGVYSSSPPRSAGQFAISGSFVFKLKPDGALGWSTYFTGVNTTPAAIAVDAGGDSYITGATYGGLPVTLGAYETTYQPFTCPLGSIFCPPPGTAAFLSKFAADGSALVFSTYVSKFVKGAAIALDSTGDAYIGGDGGLFLMSTDGAALLASNRLNGVVKGIVLDAANNVYATGQTNGGLLTTAGAFQTAPQPPAPVLPGQGLAPDAFVIEFDSTLSHIVASTLLGGEGTDSGQSISVDSAGNIVVGGVTTSQAFPTRAPIQGPFSDYSGFLASFDPGLSTLLFSTYAGDSREFSVQSVTPDPAGDVFAAGSTLVSGSYCLPTPCSLLPGAAAFANKFALASAPSIRLDAVVNSASQYASPLSPGELIDVIGSGFDASTQLLLDGTPLPLIARSAGRLTTALPADLAWPGVANITAVSASGGSNAILLPTAVSSPGIYSAAGTGVGQGYILNSNGSLNSPDNPAPVGSAITIFATGVGTYNLDGLYAVTAQPVSVFIDGFYANGIAGVISQGMYAISVYIPDPSFKMPPQVPVIMVVGPVLAANPAYSKSRSQLGLALSVRSQ